MQNPFFPKYCSETYTVFQKMLIKHKYESFGIGFSRAFIKKERTQHSVSPNMYVLVLVLEGEAIYTDNQDKKYFLKPGMGFQRIPHKKHTLSIKTQQNYSEAFIHLPLEYYKDIKKYGGSNENTPVIQFDLKGTLLVSIFELANKLNSASEKSLPIFLLEMYSFVIKFIEQSELRKIPSINLNIVEEVCDILDHTLTENIKLPDIAVGFNMSYERLRKVFKEVMHESMGEYRIRARIQYAQTLLFKRNMNINEIANHIGYPDAFALSKQFKKVKGLSPENYLKAHLY